MKGGLKITEKDINIRSALCYFPFIGWLAGIYFLLTGSNKTIRFHALQGLMVIVLFILTAYFAKFVPVFGPPLANLLHLCSFLLSLFLMHKTYSGEKHMLPTLGEMAEKNA